MKLLINPTSKSFRDLRKKLPSYALEVFWDTIENIQFSDSKDLNKLEAYVPSFRTLGITDKKRRTAIEEIAELGIWETVKKPRKCGTVIRLLNSDFVDLHFFLGDSSMENSNMMEIDGVKFHIPKEFTRDDLEEMRTGLTAWFKHIKFVNHKNLTQDLGKLSDLFKYVQQECDQKPHLLNIYSTTKNGSISKNNVINRCIEKGYTSFNYALSQKELLHNVVESSAKLSTNSKSKTVSKSSEIDINLAIHNTLKQLHESLVSKKDIAAFFSEKEDQKKLFFGHISNIQKLKKKSTELPEKYLSRLFALMTKKKEFYSDAQKRQLRDIYEVRRKKGELLRPDMTLKEFIKTCEELNVRPSEKETVKA